MHSGRIAEDRVFGQPRTFPSGPVVTRETTTWDHVSALVQGAETVYAAEGRLPLPPLVFLHGWGASHRFWKYTFGAFSPRYRCIAPDLPGFGISEKPRREYTIEAYAAWLGAFLDRLGYPKVTLVGHSMGGTVALLFALDHPERVEKLVVVNPLLQGSTGFPRRTSVLSAPVLRTILWGLCRLGPVRRWVTKDFSHVQGLEPDLAEDVIRGSYAATMQSLLSLKRTDLVPRLGSLAVPTMAIGTDRDAVLIPGHHELIRGARMETIRETGHIPMIERPAEFNALLDSFLGA